VSKHLPALKPKDVFRPWHNKDLKRATLASIIDQAGYSTDEFVGLL